MLSPTTSPAALKAGEKERERDREDERRRKNYNKIAA